MPFARQSGYSFTAVSVRQNAPALGGIYGLSNAQAWIYIHAVDDIRAALLDHLNERNPTPDFRAVTGFTFELCDTAERSATLRPPDRGTPPHRQRPGAMAVSAGRPLGDGAVQRSQTPPAERVA